MDDMKHLRRLRRAAGLTQFALHRKSGVGRTRISLAESGYVALKDREITAVRRVLLREIRKRKSRLNEVLRSAEELQPLA